MSITAAQKKYFTTQLLDWHHNDNDRSLPWKSEKDPYKIWLSEIILQQTRALQGLPYYLKFTTTYPTIKDLAAANDEDVFRIWQGLGYYNRCKNMLATARLVANDHHGTFPASYDAILGLKGIGPYTAAAIASFAYDLPHAVVDGNVYRVLSRYFAIDTPFDTTEGKKQFATLAQELLAPDNSSAYNQAIMDLGATVCTPRNPACMECPLQKNCIAYKQGMVQLLPVKSKKVQVTTRYFNYIVLEQDDKVWLRKRSGNDIWENLYEPLLVETDAPADKATIWATEPLAGMNDQVYNAAYAGKGTQRLTHRIIESTFFTAEAKTGIEVPGDGQWISKADMGKIAYPKTVLDFFKKNGYIWS
jgi:A/G-specific adenine glycosylase